MRASGRNARSAAVAIAVGGAWLLGFGLAGCTGPTGPSVTPSPAGTSSTHTSGWPGELPDPESAIAVMPGQRGDCPIDPASDDLIAFVVTTGDDTSAVRVTYPVYRTDGQRMVRRMTSPGPVITVVVADCTGEAPTTNWGFHAATDGPVSLTCAASYRGELIDSDSAAGGTAVDGGTSVDCSGAPPE